MLKYRLLHPELLRALGEAGHGARVLIADGNYPLATRSPGRAHGACTSTSRRTSCASPTCCPCWSTPSRSRRPTS